MKNLVFSAIASINRFCKQIRLERLLIVFLVGFLTLATTVDSRSARSLEKEVSQEVNRANQNSERPKTLGEFKDEAEGDVPLGERAYNITRDSAESLKQFAEEYPRVSNEDVDK